jgi:GTP-binding protein
MRAAPVTVMQAEFIISAAHPEQFPEGSAPEVAFLGRSNVGKSTLLNSLLGGKGFARISGRPGCTQSINFYRVGGCSWTFPVTDIRTRPVNSGAEMAHRELPSGRANLSYACCWSTRRGWMDDLDLKHWLEATGGDTRSSPPSSTS